MTTLPPDADKQVYNYLKLVTARIKKITERIEFLKAIALTNSWQEFIRVKTYDLYALAW